MTQAEVNKINNIIEAMSDEEKAVVVRNLPTEFLQGEITRRLKRDKEQNNLILELYKSIEKY